MRMSSHQSLNTAISHLQKFYYTFDELKEQRFDGLIITGAPVEKIEYEEVDYWPELCEVFAWSKTNVFSTFHICWGAQAGLYSHYGLQKKLLPKKLFGVYSHKVRHRREPLVRGFDDYFLIPHSRYTEVPARAIHACKDLRILAESDEAGVLLCMSRDGRRIFIMGHAEYDRNTLRDEYTRDARKGLGTAIPVNYFPDNDPEKKPLLEWRAHSYLLYSNWLNYYVYQLTPYDLNEIHWQIPAPLAGGGDPQIEELGKTVWTICIWNKRRKDAFQCSPEHHRTAKNLRNLLLSSSAGRLWETGFGCLSFLKPWSRSKMVRRTISRRTIFLLSMSTW